MAYEISGICVKCHYCKSECPAGAIGFVGTQYRIDTGKCTECGHCASVCPICAISDSGAALYAEPRKQSEMDCDLLVVGAGGSGLIAAVRAAELSGKRVIVLEKAKKPGGSAVFAHGFVLNYSDMHKKAGIEDPREALMRRAAERNPGIDGDMLRAVIYSQADFFDWLCEFGGAEDAFALMDMKAPPGVAFARHVDKIIGFPNRKFENLKSDEPSIGPGWMGTYLVRKMLEQCEKLGVKALCGYEAEELIMDAGGRISGVLAKGPGGSVRIDSRACVIASGGFLYNDGLMREVRPEFFDAEIIRRAAPTCTGDGLAMTEKIGGAVDYDSARVDIWSPPDHTFGHAAFSLLTMPEPVVVNLDGRRFYREDRGVGDAFIRQRRGIVHGIVDQTMMDVLMERSIANPFDESDRPILENYREKFAENLQNDIALKRGDTLHELGLELNKSWGTDPDVFAAEIEKYNAFCEAGHDADFGKDSSFLMPLKTPPYYAFYGQGFAEGTYGGIVTDSDMCVLNTNGERLTGLFAAGDTARGLGIKNYDDCPVSTFTWAVCSGFIAGTNAAKII